MKGVYKALCSIPIDSSPVPNGFGSSFYISCWDFVEDDLLEVATNFFQWGPLPRFFSSFYMVLIPKFKEPTSFDKFSPISLCSIAYKIFSKGIVGKLTNFLSKIISLKQSAFFHVEVSLKTYYLKIANVELN